MAVASAFAVAAWAQPEPGPEGPGAAVIEAEEAAPEGVAPEGVAPARVEPGVPPAAQALIVEGVPPLPAVIELVDAQRAALVNNPSLLAAEERIGQARARVRQAVSAYFPQVDTTFTATRTHLAENVLRANREAAFNAPLAPLQSQLGQVLTGQPLFYDTATIAQQALQAGVSAIRARSAVPDKVENYEAAVTATWLIFDGFGRWFRNAAARFGLRQTEAAFRESQRLLLDAVASAFYNVQLQRENIRIAEADRAYNERLLVDAQARRRVGTGSLSDQLNFEIRVRAAEAAVLHAKSAYTVALIGLSALMGLPDAGLPEGSEIAELTAAGPEELEKPAPLERLIEAANELRPDVQAARYAVGGARAVVGVNRAEYLPTASAFASRNGRRSENAKFEEDDFASTVGVSVSWELFTGLRRRAQVAEARSVEAEAGRLLQNAEITAYREVRQALDNVLTSMETLQLEQLNMKNVERNRSLVEREYEVGQASLVRLNEAQRDLIQAQGRLAFARVSLRQAWFALRTSTGESLAPFVEGVKDEG